MAFYLLSYDFTTEDKQYPILKGRLVEFLIKYEAKDIQTFVASTFYFESAKGYDEWVTGIENFALTLSNTEFHYVIGKLEQKNSGIPFEHHYANQNLISGLKELINNAKLNLKSKT